MDISSTEEHPKGDWEDWRGGECLLPSLVGKFYSQNTYTDVTFVLQDGSTVNAHKLILAITSPVFEGMFFGPLADRNRTEVRVTDIEPMGFRRLLQFIYNSRCLSWKIDNPEEYWHILEAANKYLNTRLIENCERKLREIAKKESGKGVVLKHLNMASRCTFETSVKNVFLNSAIRSTSKLISSDQWLTLDEGAILKIYQQEFLSATEGELYMGAKSWCLKNSATEHEALQTFLNKFASRIIPEYMSQRDFLTCVANDAFLAQVDVFRDWTIKIMIKNCADNTIRGSYRPMRVVEFYFNSLQKGNGPTSFKEEVAVIDFQDEVTAYTAYLTSTWDGGYRGLHLNINTETTSKPGAGKTQSLNINKPGPKSTKLQLPSFPELMADDEAQKTARKSALIIAKFTDGTLRAEVMPNLSGSCTTTKEMFAGVIADIEYVQVLVVIDARANMTVSAISHKQFVECVGTNDIATKDSLEELAMAKQFEFNAETYSLEAAEKEICETLRIKHCQAWHVSDDNLCIKRKIINTDNSESEITGFLRYDAVSKMIQKVVDEITSNKGRTTAYTGKGADEADKFLHMLQQLLQKYKAPKFWIMLEKEFKDDKDKLVSSVCKYDSTNGSLGYCGTICLQKNETSSLKPTTEFFNMILYNSDPNSKVYLRRFLNPLNVTRVSKEEELEKINNFDIFVIQEGKTPETGVIVDYDKFILQKINEIPVTFRPKTGSDDKHIVIMLDQTQGVSHAKTKICQAMEVPAVASVAIFECISSEGATENPLKKKSLRKPMEQPIADTDMKKIREMFKFCEDGTKTLYYHL